MYIKDLLMEENLTTIQNFYHGTNIFVTGGTGFLGKILLNKLFTSCPGIETVYVLIRNKKNKNVHERVEEIFNDPIFNAMKKVSPKFYHHVQGISGDCLLPNLGISAEDRKTLIERVNIVFHMAATVRFDEKLKVAMQINVKAAKDVMVLCNEMTNLKSALHISTAYTQCPLRKIDEKFYPPPNDTENLLLLTECTPDKLLEDMTPVLLGKWPNTYTFTKAVAEDVVKTYGKNLPVGMFRPGIVISTYRDPVCGWIDNLYGPTGAIAGAGTGVIRSLRCDPRAVANMVPVDLCVNSIITASWDVSRKHNTIKLANEIPVYNFCTSKENQLTWGDFTTKTTKYGLMYPTLKALWYLCYANRPNKIMHMLSIFFLHYVPATIFDAVCMCLGKKPRLLNTYKKIHKFMSVIEYFSLRQWDFQIENVRSLWESLCDRDKEIFFFDMTQLDWDLFLQQYFRGIRQYLLQDPLDTIPQALVRWNRLYWLHQCLKFAVLALLAHITWLIFSKVF
ncbi:fatty acyl-CoA reductase wat-like [Teleopsis dalmanni]|uniref:fatty acyl-CoA reductase wat-like n=1 Tax=Teleopsis dalmanni TaxID=139649 RepID=UPI0018CD2B73|nr:fatty acyl-CoA reductase wat-like [Teleopsis dalmanni]XP_037947416.1 fatty acyl-CoA reductase wat-like [Teleopsis dalmanni]